MPRMPKKVNKITKTDLLRKDIVKYLTTVAAYYAQNSGYDSGLVAEVLKICAKDIKNNNIY